MANDEATIARRLRLLRSTIPEAVTIGMFGLGEAIMADAIERTPVDTGRLRSTGYVAPPARVEDDRVELGFGTDYAAAVHEKTDVSHPVGEAKFLEKAVMNQAGNALRIIAGIAESYAERGGAPSAGRYPEDPKE